jgi:flagellin
LKGDKSLKKGYTFSYKNFSTETTGKVTFNDDNTYSFSVQMTTVGVDSTKSQLTQDEINELLKSFRDTGINASFTKVFETGMKAATSGYSLELAGSLADNYKVVTVTAMNSSKKGIFEIQDLTGHSLMKITLSGADAKITSIANEGDGRATISSSITAKKITAAAYTNGQTAYYDKDGNKFSVNDLDRLVTAKATDTTGDTASIMVKADGPTVYDAVGNVTKIKVADLSYTHDKVAALNLSLHVGADSTSNNQINLSIESMSARGLGVNFLKVDGTDDSNARGAIETIKAALQKVSDQRAELGAVQNRLEHTIKNLDNVVENTTSAESQIRDTDMATQMVSYSNNNILAQAGQSMLAQANQSNQGVLSLLG